MRQAVPIDEETARLAVGATVEEEVVWRDGDVVARRVERLGAIELGAVPLENPDPELVRAALREGLRREGLGLLNWTREAEALRARLAFCHRELGPPWPAMDDDALLASLDPASAARDRAGLRRLDVTAALRGLLPWECAARLDEVAPERVTVPSGSRIRIDYTGERPVLAAKLQELFGWQEAPRVAGVPLVVHLLSPMRPPGRRHRGPRLVLARGLPERTRGAARTLSTPPVAGGPGHRGADPPYQRPPPLSDRPEPRWTASAFEKLRARQAKDGGSAA